MFGAKIFAKDVGRFFFETFFSVFLDWRLTFELSNRINSFRSRKKIPADFFEHGNVQTAENRFCRELGNIKLTISGT